MNKGIRQIPTKKLKTKLKAGISKQQESNRADVTVTARQTHQSLRR